MGLLAQFTCCSCGYGTGELTLGPSPRPDEFDPVLVSCSGCKTLREMERKRAAAGCRSHRKAYSLYDDEDEIPCPKCGAKGELLRLALWD